ncbi:hypothetical protein [Halobellus rubicundus]|uniref:DUF1565 domain-containing protein n=1 Tax=Halobellus rubicundus TaxID=2996466 RepID=A0ABD5MBG7_9EURY
MRRRTFLALGVGAGGSLAGCLSESGPESETAPSPEQATASATGGTPTATASADEPATPRENPETIFVSPDGSDRNVGTRDEPVGRLQTAIDAALPGQTVYALPGEYGSGTSVRTARAGTASAPITITGPPEAVYRSRQPFEINHDHVHLTGLTFDGLYDPSRPEDPDAYAESQLQVNETFYERIKSGERPDRPVEDDEYLTGAVVKPHAVGNCRADLIKVHWSENVEVGEFRVHGPAGVKYLLGDADSHNGEIVYVGNPPGKGYPEDETNNVHIHHIDASAGHGHAEMVDLKPGTHHCTVEYCTSAGGGLTADETTPVVISHNGHHNVVRWNEIYGCAMAVEFDAGYPEQSYENDLYGNYFHDFTDVALGFEDREKVSLDDQRHVCGNRVEPDRGQPLTAECRGDLPEGSGVGHTGGDSPWA